MVKGWVGGLGGWGGVCEVKNFPRVAKEIISAQPENGVRGRGKRGKNFTFKLVVFTT